MHTLITGVTMTGKTTLARMFAREHARRGHNVIVYDPMGTGTAGGDWGEEEHPDRVRVFTEESEFMEHVADAPPSAVFVDESDLVFSHVQLENHWLARRGRHYGHRVYMLTQRPQMIAPNCRTQTGVAYMFRLARSDSDFVLREFGHDIKGNPDLDTGEFLVLRSGARGISRGNVFKLVGAAAPKREKAAGNVVPLHTRKVAS